MERVEADRHRADYRSQEPNRRQAQAYCISTVTIVLYIIWFKAGVHVKCRNSDSINPINFSISAALFFSNKNPWWLYIRVAYKLKKDLRRKSLISQKTTGRDWFGSVKLTQRTILDPDEFPCGSFQFQHIFSSADPFQALLSHLS